MEGREDLPSEMLAECYEYVRKREDELSLLEREMERVDGLAADGTPLLPPRLVYGGDGIPGGQVYQAPRQRWRAKQQVVSADDTTVDPFQA